MPKVLKSCPKFNKSPNLVTLLGRPNYFKIVLISEKVNNKRQVRQLYMQPTYFVHNIEQLFRAKYFTAGHSRGPQRTSAAEHQRLGICTPPTPPSPASAPLRYINLCA